MSKDEKKDESAKAPEKKSKKKLLIIVIAAVLVLGGGGGAYFMLAGGSSADAAPKAPEKGAVVPMDTALTINLADSHFLKLAFTIQETVDAGTTALDNAEAIDLAIDQYSGMSVAALQTAKGREESKAQLLASIEKAYNTKDLQMVMDIYFTQFVMQ